VCNVDPPQPPPVPPPPPDYQSEQAAIASTVQEERQKRIFAGLSSTIATGSGGVLTKTSTTRGAQ
jgi:hypothetical protein